MLGAWIVMLLPLAYAAVASFFILWPRDATVASNSVTRFTYETDPIRTAGHHRIADNGVLHLGTRGEEQRGCGC